MQLYQSLMSMLCRETDKGNLTHNSSFLGTTADMPYDHSDVQIMRNQTLEAVGGGADVLAIAGNLGVMGLLFDNPHYKQRVSLMGLRPDYAYGCAIDFLFAPGPAVLEAFEKEFEVLQSPALKIGIQIRLGDSFLQGNNEPMEHGEATFDFVKQFFECAEGLQGTFGQPGQQVVWFLISDSIQVRQAAVDMYGSDRVMTRLESPGHVANTAGADQQQAMLLAAGEHWLFGMADYHVISARGGFGRNAALRSRKWHSMYRLDQAIPPDSRQICDGIHTKPVDFSSIAMTAPFV